MRKVIKTKGKRIRKTDKNLVLHTVFFSCFGIFAFIMFCFYGRRLLQIDWTKVSLDKLEIIRPTPYFFTAILTAVILCAVSWLCFYHYKRDTCKQLVHRQALARMVLENGWYESEKRQDANWFKDVHSGGAKEVITWFPKMYYKMENGEVIIRVQITMGKYQEQYLHLEKKLETGLYCELTDRVLTDSYVEYTLLYDMIANRISIDEVEAEDGKLRLMKNVWWKYDSLPHMLIAGGTGGGKTYFILTVIEALLRTDADIRILDPKNADLADLAAVMPDVYYRKDDMIYCINEFYEDMMERSEAMKQMDGYKTGENYAYLGLPAQFLIFDEYVAFMEMLGSRESQEVLNKLKQIVMLGRQAGYFLILACQRPDAKYLGDGIRDQFNFRVALGRMSELGYSMMFGESNKDFFLKQIKGRGYVDVGTSVISEFYTPVVPKGHDFLNTIGELVKKREAEKSFTEKKDVCQEKQEDAYREETDLEDEPKETDPEDDFDEVIKEED